MLECYVVCLFFPKIPKAISMTRGEQGTAKTTGQGLVKMLVDPCTAKLLGVPESRNELIQILSHNYVAYFDNVTFLKDWIVDELCRAVTGSGNQKRRLFTDDEDVVANFMRGIGINGINLGSARPDLIDRGLIHDFEPITDEERKLEQDIWAKFEQLRPQVLAYIFDTLVKVLELKKNGGIKLARLPRMADFALHCEMISRCMDNPDNAFINAFAKNIQVQTIESIASEPVAIVIIELMKDRTYWGGAPTKLYSEVQDIAYKIGINTIDKSWPKAPNALSRRVNVIKTSLRKAGIDIKSINEDSHKNVVTIQITKISPQSPQSPQNEKEGANRAQNASDIDTKNAGIFGTSKPDGRTHSEQKTVQIPSESIEPKSEGKEVKATEPKNSHTYASDEKVEQLLIDSLGFDFEFDPSDNNRIDAVSFVDSMGNCEVKFRQRDFDGDEPALLDYINTKLLSYLWTMGWNIQGNTGEESNPKITDLAILDQRCKINGVPSIIRFGYKGVPFIRHSELGHIDLLNVYGKIMVKDGIYHSYRTNGLDDVSKALLGYGKYKNYSGKDFYSLLRNSQIEEAEKYSLMDSQLVMDLAKYKNYEALEAMFGVSSIIKMDFERVCRTNLTTWWSAVFNKTVPEHMKPDKDRFSGTYKGADVLDPKKGIYDDIVVVDGKSLYPSVAINYNISFDTISTCARCKEDPKTRVGNMFPYEFVKDFKFVNPNEDWLCRCTDSDKQGFFPKHLEGFKAKRLEEKALGNKANQHALKILINGGYGAFGSKDFRYYDPRVAELITATGRYILSKMQDVAKKEYDFNPG